MKAFFYISKFKIRTIYAVAGVLLVFIFLMFIVAGSKIDTDAKIDSYKKSISSIKVNNDRVNQIIDYRYDDPDILASLDDYLP